MRPADQRFQPLLDSTTSDYLGKVIGVWKLGDLSAVLTPEVHLTFSRVYGEKFGLALSHPGLKLWSSVEPERALRKAGQPTFRRSSPHSVREAPKQGLPVLHPLRLQIRIVDP